MTKEAVRKSMRFFRKNMAEDERKEKDALIRKNLYGLAVFQNACYFFPFVSYGTEVDTQSIIRKLLEEGKQVAVPKVCGKEMDFYDIRSFDDLEKGPMGILEPVTNEIVEVKEGVMLIPGLAFDVSKRRVGYGGGYYDRYFERICCGQVTKIGIAYDFQVVDYLETEHFDRTVDLIVTEKRIIWE